MLKAIKEQKGKILAGLLATAAVSGASYWLERSYLREQAGFKASEQLSRIEERLNIATSEVESAAAFLAASASSLGAFDDFLSRLTISKSGKVYWFLVKPVLARDRNLFEETIRQQPRLSSFAIKSNGGQSEALLPVILARGPWQTDLIGLDLSAERAIADTAKTFQDNPDPQKAAFAFIPAANGQFPSQTLFFMRFATGPAVSDSRFRQNVVSRGLELAVLSSLAGVEDGQHLQIELLSPDGKVLSHLETGALPASGVQLAERLVEFPAYTFRARLTQPAIDRFPIVWLLIAIGGLAATALATAISAGMSVSSRAAALLRVLNSTENQLSETARKEIAFFDNAGTANCETDVTTGKLLRVNDALCNLLGYSRDELLGKTFKDITHPDDLGISASAMRDIAENPLEFVQFEKRYIRKDGATIWGLVNARLHSDQAQTQKTYLTVIVDITTRKQDEQIKNNLVRELAHRVRNTMQLTASLARQSGVNAKSVSDYDSKFRKRLAALNTAQDLLFDTGWKSASLQQIAERTIKPFVSDNIVIDLPDVALPTQHAQTLALSIHELASNSARFGAAIRGGTVHFSGTTRTDPEQNTKELYLRWEEKSPARFAAPRKSGFGRIMLDTALPEQFHGKSKTSWNRTGFVYEAWLTLPS